MKAYNPKEIESKWQEKWEHDGVYKALIDKNKKKSYVLDMFPYPSGEGLHVGHVRVYTASDIYARYKRMSGYEVLHPMGWDAFGLPAEEFALKNKIHPRISTDKNISNFRRQMKSLGLSYDWSREVDTTDEKFYKWTQWIFKQIYKKGLAYESHEPINWCPSCMTGLANEDLEDGKCERCGSIVEKKPIRQWVLEITKYADRLLNDLDALDQWPSWLKDLQRNWIGRSEGAEIEFKIVGEKEISFIEENSSGLVGYGVNINMSTKYSYENKFTVFTTRADTLFGCTYTVLAPEHALVLELLDKNIITNKSEVEKYLLGVKDKTDIERGAEGKEKTGVRLDGVMAINPANQAEIPVYIADYVLASYGTGAIMAVPAHDTRDGEFAKKYEIEKLKVVNSPVQVSAVLGGSYDQVIGLSAQELFTEHGVLVNSGKFDGMTSEEARVKITEAVGGKIVTRYKLREWVFARQRYWGEPFPIVFDADMSNGHKSYVVADSELPVKLPQVEHYEPTGTGESPLANITDWVNVYGYINGENEFVSCGKDDAKAKLFKRETNTMPQWAGSSWYWLRFMDANNDSEIFSQESADYWGDVDIYVGGAEHATRHLIYGRFWHKFLYDLGLVKNIEPFKRSESVGLILGEGGVKMSKRLGNVINPDTVVDEYGADVLRMYEMFIGPFGQASAWDPKSIIGLKRFCDRVWALQDKLSDGENESESILHQTIKKVGIDIETFKFNTAISQLMMCLNAFEKSGVNREQFKLFLQLLAPFAPHMTEELWMEMGEGDTVHLSVWPLHDESKMTATHVTIAVQIAGKLRGTFEIEKNASDEVLLNTLKALDIWNKYVISEPKKVIIIKNKLVNIVI